MINRINLFILFIGISLVITANSTLNVNAQNYEGYYPNDESPPYEDKSYDTPYEDKSYDTPYEDKDKDKSILIVKKNLYICDEITENSTVICGTDDLLFAGPDSGRYIECNDEICTPVTKDLFTIAVEAKKLLEGNAEGTKINLNDATYFVTEEAPNQFNSQIIAPLCQLSGFDGGFHKIIDSEQEPVEIIVCTDYVGYCSGSTNDMETRECNVNNYIVIGGEFPTDD